MKSVRHFLKRQKVSDTFWLRRKDVEPLIRAALREDEAFADVTSRAVIPLTHRVKAQIIVKSPGVLAGGPIAVWTLHAVDPSLRCVLKMKEGAPLHKGQPILTVEGSTRSLFAAERVALNLLGHLSGIATLTQAFVKQVRGTRAQILDTRKTLPGLRLVEKYAVRVGGGHTHRSSLAEAILIKTNHLVACGMRDAECGTAIEKSIAQAKRVRPKRFVEIEVTDLCEFQAALCAKSDAILLDNWTLPSIRQAILLRNSALRIPHSALLLEVSGGVTLANVRAIAQTGVDRISIGRLTHSAPSLDVSLQVAGVIR